MVLGYAARRRSSVRWMRLLKPDGSGMRGAKSRVLDRDGRALRRRRTCSEDALSAVWVVAYAAGQLGKGAVRSQGHVHAIAAHSGWSSPELFEIWEGKAIIYAQERTTDDPGRCVAVAAIPGEKVVVPPGWAHAVINADIHRRMVFGAWCDRQYGFDYTGVRAHGGLAHFPIVQADGAIEWMANDRYRAAQLEQRKSRQYPELGLDPIEPIYMQYRRHVDSVQWVAQPERFAELWPQFEP